MNIIKYPIPNGWRQSSLQKISNIQTGSTPLRSNHDRYFVNGNIPWVKTMDLNNGKIFCTDENITDIALRESSCKLLDPGTILVAMYGGFNQIGRTGIMTFSGATNQAISSLSINNDEAIGEFVLYWLNGNIKLWRRFAASSRKDPNITKRDVELFPILLPPIEEQHKIAEILSTWDEAIRTTEKLIAALEKRKKGLMQRLLTGLLRFPGFTDEWETTKLGKCTIESPTYGANSPSKDFVEGYPRYIRITDIADSNQLHHNEKVGVSLEGNEKYMLKDGDFLFARTGATVGKTYLYKSGDGDAIYAGYLIRFRLNTKKILPEYLKYFVQTHRYWYWVKSTLHAGAQPNINAQEYSSMPIPLPSLDEQSKIAQVFSTFDVVIHTNEKIITDLKKQKQGLMQRLLTGQVRVSV